jgi:hypothetical protein
MRVLHGLVVALLAVAVGARVLLEEPGSFIVAGPLALVAFIVGGAPLALDFLDRRWRWFAADAALAALAVYLVARV